jgi:hypothetical protein
MQENFFLHFLNLHEEFTAYEKPAAFRSNISLLKTFIIIFHFFGSSFDFSGKYRILEPNSCLQFSRIHSLSRFHNPGVNHFEST